MKIMKFLQRKLQRKLDDGRLPVEEALAKELADNRTLKEKYGTVEHYLWTLTVEELRPEKPRSVGNLSGRYDASLVREITDEFTGEFQSTVNVIWDEYVRRVGIAAAYTALQEMLAQEPDEDLTRSFLYNETKDFKEFFDVFDQEVDKFWDKFKQENKDSKLAVDTFAFGKFFHDGYSVKFYHVQYDLFRIIRHYNNTLYYPIPLILKAVREEINRRYTSQLILEPALKLLDEVETHVNNQLQLRQKLF